jgi:glycosyltransferase involved in cell wall biosynthesis
MRVAYIIASLQNPSGWRSHARDFIGAMAAHVDPVLYVPSGDQGEAQALFPGLPVFSLPATQEASLSSLRGLPRLAEVYTAIQQGDWPAVDLVHSLEAYPTGLVGLWLARRLGCPHVLTAHGTYAVIWRTRPLDRPVYAWVLRRTGMVCPVSTGTARMLQAHFGAALAGTRLRPVLNGNNFHRQAQPCEGDLRERELAEPASEPAQPVSELAQPGSALSAYAARPLPEVPTLLSVGEVKPRKGYHLSLEAFARVQAVLPEARYWIAGRFSPTPYFETLQAFMAERGLRNVEFLGPVPDEELKRRYRLASLFLLTPQVVGFRFEGFGLVYLEAGAYGLPVVATASGGVPDVVIDGETGFLAPPQDSEAVAQAILRLLRDPELSQRMGQANRRWAETLTWERTALEQVQAYEELLRR